MRRRIESSGPRDVASAWERYADLTRWSDWAPQIREVEATSTTLAAGVCGVVRGPAGVVVPFRVEDVDAAARTWRWTVTALGMTITMVHDLTPRGDGTGTTAGLTMEGPAAVALTYGPAARLALTRLCR